jgi:hypothetical protein
VESQAREGFLVVLGAIDVEGERRVLDDCRIEASGAGGRNHLVEGDAEARNEGGARSDRDGVDPAVPCGSERERPGGPGECVQGVRVDERAIRHHDERTVSRAGIRERQRDRGGVPVPGVHEDVDPGRCRARSGCDE